MNKLAVLIFISVLLSQMVIAQTNRDSITISTFRGKLGSEIQIFFKNGERIRSLRQMSRIMQPDPDASRMLRRAKRQRNAGLVVAFAGAAFAGYELGTGIGSKPTNEYTGRAAIGIAVEALGIPLIYAASHSQRKAIGIYNRNAHKGAFKNTHPEYYISFSGNAVGLTIKF